MLKPTRHLALITLDNGVVCRLRPDGSLVIRQRLSIEKSLNVLLIYGTLGFTLISVITILQSVRFEISPLNFNTILAMSIYPLTFFFYKLYFLRKPTTILDKSRGIVETGTFYRRSQFEFSEIEAIQLDIIPFENTDKPRCDQIGLKLRNGNLIPLGSITDGNARTETSYQFVNMLEVTLQLSHQSRVPVDYAVHSKQGIYHLNNIPPVSSDQEKIA